MYARTTPCGALTPLALSMVLTLTACGGGGGSDDEQTTDFHPGEVVTFSKTTQDGSTQESHYLVHGVTANGDLRADETAPGLTGVLVGLPLEAAEIPQDASRLTQLRDFYKQLWQGIAERRNDGSDIAAEIGAYETDVGALYDDYRQSEFASVKDYVAFYEQVGENPYFDAQESVEEELVQFFYQTGWRQGAWLQALQRQQWDWPRFLQLMAQRGHTFDGLLSQYRSGTSRSMEDFIARYVNSPLLKKANLLAKTTPEGGGSVFHVVNPTWKFWDKSFERSMERDYFGIYRARTYASIVSPLNKNPDDYELGSWSKYLCTTYVRVHGRANVISTELIYMIRLGMSVPHVRHPDGWAYGHWIQKIEFLPHTTSEGGGMVMSKNIVGVAEIKDLENVATNNDWGPKPRFNIETRVSIPRIFNTKVWKTMHAIDLNTPEICTTVRD